jgi:dipeptidyl-peptidase-4
MLILRGPEYYRCAISVAPVTDMKLYDTIWTERYMGLLHENEPGYKAADVLTYAHNLQNPLLLVHGSGDDNVHPQNTMMLVDKLIAANKQFELMIYPNRNHGITGNNASRHLFNMMTNFLCRNLNLKQ